MCYLTDRNWKYWSGCQIGVLHSLNFTVKWTTILLICLLNFKVMEKLLKGWVAFDGVCYDMCVVIWCHHCDTCAILVFALRGIYTTSKISVRESESELGRNQNKWIDFSCLHWSESMSEIFVARRYVLQLSRTRTSEFIQGYAMRMSKAVCLHGCYCRLSKWP